MIRARLAAAAVAAAALAGCARTDPHLVFLEAPLWAALDGGSLAERLAPLGEQVGRRFEVRPARSAAAPLRELEELLNERSYRGVVVGPLLALEVERIAGMFEAVEFVALRLADADALGPPSALPANVTRLSFARRDGFRGAGRLLAAIEPAGAIGVVSVWGYGESVVAAFGEGYAAAGGSASIDHRRLVSVHDDGQLRRFLEDFAGAGIGTVLLHAGPLTADGLRIVRGEGMRAIIANGTLAAGGQGGPLPEAVLFSIDDDLTGALREVFRALDAGSADPGMVGATVVRWGGAADLPAEAAAHVDRPAGP